MIAEYPLEEWNGGKVRHIVRDKIILLERGQVFHIEDKFFYIWGSEESYLNCICRWKTLLIKQIEIMNPDIIWFVIGPYYVETISLTMGIDKNEQKRKRLVKDYPIR